MDNFWLLIHVVALFGVFSTWEQYVSPRTGGRVFEPEIHIRKAERNISWNTSGKYWGGTFEASRQCPLVVVELGLESQAETFNNPTVSEPLRSSGAELQKAEMVTASPAFDRDMCYG